MGLVVGASMLTGSVLASETSAGAAHQPTPATAQVVSSFVSRYAAREDGHPLRNGPSNSVASERADVTLYSTADREVVFASFRVAGADRIALVETHGGRITRFTDFAAARPKNVSRATADGGDAQAQARSILSPTPSAVAVTFARAAPEQQRTRAQEQAAALLQFTTVTSDSAQRFQIATRNVPRFYGDSQQMARALLTSSSGR